MKNTSKREICMICSMEGLHLLAIGAHGKQLHCSGFEMLIIEAGICASGSIDQVYNGFTILTNQ